MFHDYTTFFTKLSKRLLVLAGVLLSLAIGGVYAYYQHLNAQPTTEHVITLTDRGFSPETLIIARGDSVRFVTERGVGFWPASNDHPIHDDYPAFDPKRTLTAEESWSFTFKEVGIYSYHDHVYPVFRGSISVE